MDDFANVIAYELREDLARRYFGSRIKIENEIATYTTILNQSASSYKRQIRISLQRIHYLLANEQLYQSFLRFTQFPEFLLPLEQNPDFSSDPATLFSHIKLRGFSRKRRYKNLLFCLYTELEGATREYRDEYTSLTDMHKVICDSISTFSRNYDLGMILQFFREIDDPYLGGADILDTSSEKRGLLHMNRSHFIEPPPVVSSCMGIINPITDMRSATNNLIDYYLRGYPFYQQYRDSRFPSIW